MTRRAIPLAALLSAFVLGGCGGVAHAGDTITYTSSQTRCYHHHVQKRTLTHYVNSDGTIAAATTYGPWVTRKRSC